ncbi:MAG: hypothetical protein Q9174_005096, partial [Haloplaca sp. 1 TL-2023]
MDSAMTAAESASLDPPKETQRWWRGDPNFHRLTHITIDRAQLSYRVVGSKEEWKKFGRSFEVFEDAMDDPCTEYTKQIEDKVPAYVGPISEARVWFPSIDLDKGVLISEGKAASTHSDPNNRTARLRFRCSEVPTLWTNQIVDTPSMLDVHGHDAAETWFEHTSSRQEAPEPKSGDQASEMDYQDQAQEGSADTVEDPSTFPLAKLFSQSHDFLQSLEFCLDFRRKIFKPKRKPYTFAWAAVADFL